MVDSGCRATVAAVTNRHFLIGNRPYKGHLSLRRATQRRPYDGVVAMDSAASESFADIITYEKILCPDRDDIVAQRVILSGAKDLSLFRLKTFTP